MRPNRSRVNALAYFGVTIFFIVVLLLNFILTQRATDACLQANKQHFAPVLQVHPNTALDIDTSVVPIVIPQNCTFPVDAEAALHNSTGCTPAAGSGVIYQFQLEGLPGDFTISDGSEVHEVQVQEIVVPNIRINGITRDYRYSAMIYLWLVRPERRGVLALNMIIGTKIGDCFARSQPFLFTVVVTDELGLDSQVDISLVNLGGLLAFFGTLLGTYKTWAEVAVRRTKPETESKIRRKGINKKDR